MKILNYLNKLSKLTLLCCLFMASSLVQASTSESAGKVLRVKGDVNTVDASSRVLKRGSKIFQAETIETSVGAVAQFRMIDGALFSLRENTQWKISSYKKASGATNESSVKMELLKGGLRTISGEIGRKNKSNYQLNTPVASIGIRGTHFSAELIDGELFVAVWDGAVDVGSSSCDENISSNQVGLKISADGSCETLTELPLTLSQKHNVVVKSAPAIEIPNILISEEEDDPVPDVGVSCSDCDLAMDAGVITISIVP